MRTLSLFLALTLLTIVSVSVYSVTAVLSDGRTYSKHSLDYLILTPDIIKDLPFDLSEGASYAYSTADGPKPATCVVEFTSVDNRDQLSAAIDHYLLSKGLTRQSPTVFSRPDQEVQVSLDSKDQSHTRVRLEVFDYIN